MTDQHPQQPQAVPPAEVVPGPGGEPAFDLGAMLGGGDLSGLLEAAQAMQAGLVEAQAKAAETEVEGQAGGGVVRIRATAGMDFLGVSIDPEAVDPADVEGLEDLVLAALRDLVSRANDVQAEALGGLGDGMGGMGGIGGFTGP